MKKNEQLEKIVHYITLHPHMDLNEGCDLIVAWANDQLNQDKQSQKQVISILPPKSTPVPTMTPSPTLTPTATPAPTPVPTQEPVIENPPFEEPSVEPKEEMEAHPTPKKNVGKKSS